MFQERHCASPVLLRRHLRNQPDVLSLGLIWDSEHPTQRAIRDVIHAIGRTLTLRDVSIASLLLCNVHLNPLAAVVFVFTAVRQLFWWRASAAAAGGCGVLLRQALLHLLPPFQTTTLDQL